MVIRGYGKCEGLIAFYNVISNIADSEAVKYADNRPVKVKINTQTITEIWRYHRFRKEMDNEKMYSSFQGELYFQLLFTGRDSQGYWKKY